MNSKLWRALMLALIIGAALFAAFGSYVEVSNDEFGLSMLPSAHTSAYVVRDVDSKSAADRAGIRPGDTVAPVKHDFLSRATLAYPARGAKVMVLVNGIRRVTLIETKSDPAYTNLPYTIVRLCFLAVAALLAWRRPDDRSTRMLVWFLFTIGLGIALNNHEFGSPVLSVIVLQMGSVSLLLFSFGAGARFAATFPEGTAKGMPRILAALTTAITTLGILCLAATVLGILPDRARPLTAAAVTLAFLIAIVMLVAILIERYANTRAEDRRRRQWIFLILGLGLAGPAVDLAFQLFASFNQTADELGSLSLLIIPFGLAYVILRHRVIDVGFVLNRAAVYGLMSIVIVGIFVVVETLLAKYVENSSHVTSTAVQLAVALGLGFSIRAMHARVDRFVDTVLFRERHEAEAAIRNFAHDAPYITDGPTLGKRCVETALRYAGTSNAGIWMRGEMDAYVPVESTFRPSVPVNENDPAIVAMRARRIVVELGEDSSSLPGALAFPMIVRGELLGLLVCGGKAHGETYAPDERDALEAMALAVGHSYDALEIRGAAPSPPSAGGKFRNRRGLGYVLGEGSSPPRSSFSTVSDKRFTPEMTVDQAFKLHAGARRVFARFHLGGCSNCAISESHTIGAVSEDYGIPLPMLLDSLNALWDQGGLSVGDKVRIPEEIRSKIPQLANVPEIGEIKSVEAGAYTAEFGDVRLQGLAEDFLPVVADVTPA